MNEFLDVADLALRAERVPDEDKPHFERVFRAIARLQQVHSKSAALDLVNVESVFGAFEMARTLGTLAGFDPAEIEALGPSMTKVIVRTLELELVFRQREGGFSSPHPYDAFAHLLGDLSTKASPRHSVAVLTFNYDLALEFALQNRRLPVFYSLAGEKRASANQLPLLKLHGSLNWFRCGASGGEHSKHVVTIHDFGGARFLPNGSGGFFFSLDVDRFQPANGCVVGDRVIVPPTWSKGEHHRQISTVWARAAEELRDAENIIVIGYSLPPSDGFFPLLFGLGTVGDRVLKRFWVFDPKKDVGVRFREMLGPGARRRFTPYHTVEKSLSHRGGPIRFVDAIRILREEFKLPPVP